MNERLQSWAGVQWTVLRQAGAVSALQTGSERRQITHRNQPASGQVGISRSPSKTSLPASPSCRALELNTSGWPGASKIWEPKTSPTEVISGPTLDTD